MEHGKEPEFGAEVLGIGADCAQGLGGGVEQDAIDDRLVVKGDCSAAIWMRGARQSG